MTLLGRAADRVRLLTRQRASRRDERGVTMIEMFVAMIITTIAGSIFIGGVVTLFKVSNNAQAVTSTAQQNNQAYQSLDKIVRYAAAISTPGKSTGTGATGDWYVELRDTTGGYEQCIQLRVDIATKQLQRRTWNASNLSTLSSWVPLASDLTNTTVASGSADQPFKLEDIAPTDQGQRLRITVVTQSGPSNQKAASRSQFTFTALNSTNPPATGAICQQAGRQ